MPFYNYYFCNFYNQAWVIVLTCFLCNGLAMGINNAYGVIYVRLVEELKEQGDQNPASKAGKCKAILRKSESVITSYIILDCLICT